MDRDFLEEVDKYAYAHFLSRSDLIRLALMEKMGLKFMGDKLDPGPSEEEQWQEIVNRIKIESELDDQNKSP